MSHTKITITETPQVEELTDKSEIHMSYKRGLWSDPSTQPETSENNVPPDTLTDETLEQKG